MKEIPLTQGQVALVDDEDYDWLNTYNWHTHITDRKKYAAITRYANYGRHVIIRMHWLIMGEKGIDHKDGNGLNNQRTNLRKATVLQNSINRAKTSSKTSSIYKGVYKATGRNKFTAYITINKKRKWLGQFDTEKEAAMVYDEEAIKSFGEFARLNFPIQENL